MLNTIPLEAWEHEVQGRLLAPGSLGYQLDQHPRLMVFLRHLG